ncbi:hypothetical protein IGB42_02275 [Andreprevotia sp. IGB-42]|uniref:DUF4142 domain-containing protein n=1 Tax=Andreprevotia sp. IGB-42 TaxID=2497473 RepID=UPI001357AD53|nr:DUF4142 domain-containing protein [Andreprevotia sp. IGB-42]KAF0813346.1 hypothetical protein IGB42_02275 [Andreprevotia sp. IGB-42]
MPENHIPGAIAPKADAGKRTDCKTMTAGRDRILDRVPRYLVIAGALLIGTTNWSSSAMAATSNAVAAGVTAPTVKPGIKPISDPEALAFFDTAARSDLAQIRMARYVVRTAKDPGVIFFAKRMLQEHGADLQQLSQLAHNKGVKLPTELETESLQFITRLEKLQPPMLEHEYAAIGGINFHLKEQAAYKKQAEDGKDETLKSHARDALPKIADHIRMARHLIANTQSE